MDTVDAHWGNPSFSTPKQNVLITQPTRSTPLNEPESSTISSAPAVVGTSYDMGLGWADTHYYEKQLPPDTVSVLN